jgi:hypothetical protein
MTGGRRERGRIFGRYARGPAQLLMAAWGCNGFGKNPGGRMRIGMVACGGVAHDVDCWVSWDPRA